MALPPDRDSVTPRLPPEPPLPPARRVSEIRLQAALSDVARKERKSLLAVSLAALTVVKVGLVPTKISALGIDFNPADQRALLGVVSLILGYFLITFTVYALNDYIAWRNSLQAVSRDWTEYHRRMEEVGASTASRRDWETLRRRERFPIFSDAVRVFTAQTRPVALLRNVLDFIVPVVFGLYVLFITLFAALAPASAASKPSAVSPASTSSFTADNTACGTPR